MIVLGIDSSTSGCSAAVWTDDRVLARRFEMMARGQAEALVPMIVAAMGEAGVAFRDLSLVAVTVGPGTFTGIRIGLAAARAIGLSAGLPVAGILSTEALASAVPAAERCGRHVLAAVDAKRADLFVQRFTERLEAVGPPEAMLPEAAATAAPRPAILVGDGAARLAALLPDAVLSSAPTAPDAAVVAAVAARRWRAGAALPPVPMYLRAPDVTLPGAASR